MATPTRAGASPARRQRQQHVHLTQDLDANGVRSWLSQVLEPELYQTATQALDERGERPDGEVLLDMGSAAELREFGFNFTISKKLFLRIQQERATQGLGDAGGSQLLHGMGTPGSGPRAAGASLPTGSHKRPAPSAGHAHHGDGPIIIDDDLPRAGAPPPPPAAKRQALAAPSAPAQLQAPSAARPAATAGKEQPPQQEQRSPAPEQGLELALSDDDDDGDHPVEEAEDEQQPPAPATAPAKLPAGSRRGGRSKDKKTSRRASGPAHPAAAATTATKRVGSAERRGSAYAAALLKAAAAAAAIKPGPQEDGDATAAAATGDVHAVLTLSQDPEAQLTQGRRSGRKAAGKAVPGPVQPVATASAGRSPRSADGRPKRRAASVARETVAKLAFKLQNGGASPLERPAPRSRLLQDELAVAAEEQGEQDEEAEGIVDEGMEEEQQQQQEEERQAAGGRARAGPAAPRAADETADLVKQVLLDVFAPRGTRRAGGAAAAAQQQQPPPAAAAAQQPQQERRVAGEDPPLGPVQAVLRDVFGGARRPAAPAAPALAQQQEQQQQVTAAVEPGGAAPSAKGARAAATKGRRSKQAAAPAAWLAAAAAHVKQEPPSQQQQQQQQQQAPTAMEEDGGDPELQLALRQALGLAHPAAASGGGGGGGAAAAATARRAMEEDGDDPELQLALRQSLALARPAAASGGGGGAAAAAARSATQPATQPWRATQPARRRSADAAADATVAADTNAAPAEEEEPPPQQPAGKKGGRRKSAPGKMLATPKGGAAVKADPAAADDEEAGGVNEEEEEEMVDAADLLAPAVATSGRRGRKPAAAPQRDEEEEDDEDGEGVEEARAEADSDYAPSDEEMREGGGGGAGGRAAAGRVLRSSRRLRGRRVKVEGGSDMEEGGGAAMEVDSEDGSVKEEDDGEEVEPEVEEAPSDLFFIPRKDDDPLPAYKLHYDAARATNGFKLLLELMDIDDMVRVLNMVGADGEGERFYMGRKINPETKVVTLVKRKRTPQQYRRLVMTHVTVTFTKQGQRVNPLNVIGEEANLRMLLQDMAQHDQLRERLFSYLECCFRITPPVAEDGSNLPDVMIKLWSTPILKLPPEECLLGVKTIHISNPGKGYQKQGTVQSLLEQLEGYKDDKGLNVAPTAKIHARKHTTVERKHILEWLKVARSAPRGSVRASYRSYMEGTAQSPTYYVKVSVVLRRPDVIAGVLDREDGGEGAAAAADDDDPLAPPEHLREHVEEASACDLLALFGGLDHAQGTKENKERFQQAQHMVDVVNHVMTELEEQGVQDEGQDPEGLVTMGQVEGLLASVEGQTYDEPRNFKRVLKQLRLKLLPYQQQAVRAQMLEEQSSGTGRHLWIELPLPTQPKYRPSEVAKRVIARRERREFQAKERALDDMNRPIEDWEAWRREATHQRADTEVANAQRAARAGQRNASLPAEEEERAARRAAAQRAAEADGGQVGWVRPALEAQEEANAKGVVPPVRIFYSPLLNALYWGVSLKDMQRADKDHPFLGKSRLALSLQRGTMCCLEVGMGKTAVALAVAMQGRRGMHTHCGRDVDDEDEWDDELLFDHYDGHPGHLHRGGTLVIAPITLLPQWETIEIRKFCGRDFKEKEVYNAKGVQGKRRRLLPCELAVSSVVLVSPEWLCSKQQSAAALFSSVQWERIIVDEAHQEPGLLDVLPTLPTRHLMMLTGTPITREAKDVVPMLHAMGMPPFTLMARSAYRLGFVLKHTMVRYTNSGLTLTGEANLLLPPKKEQVVMVPWGRDAARYQHLHAYCKTLALQHKGEVDKNVKWKNNVEAQAPHNPRAAKYKKKIDKHPTQFQFNALKLMGPLRLLRHACAGGIAVQWEMDRSLIQEVRGGKEARGPGEEEDEEEEQHDEEERRDMVTVECLFKSKVKALIKAIQELRVNEPKAKMVIFSCFKDTLTYIQNELPEGLNSRTMHPGMSMKQRGEALDAFINDPPTTIFLLSAQLAAVGLTLTAASHMFLMEPSMNPAQELQAVGRIYRMGQTRPVTITRLVMEDSVETRIRDMMAKRAAEQRIDEFVAPANVRTGSRGRTGVPMGQRDENLSGFTSHAKIEDWLELFE